jgi:hypothetical protein
MNCEFKWCMESYHPYLPQKVSKIPKIEWIHSRLPKNAKNHFGRLGPLGVSPFFLYFLRSSYMQPCGWSCPRAERQGAKKEVCFVHKILVFHFFPLFSFAHGFTFCHLQCDRYNLNVKFLIFFKNFLRSTALKFWVKTPIKKNNSSSFMTTNMELRFEPCLLNLIWKWGAKDPEKREEHLVIINFGVKKKFTLKNTQKKKNFDVW